MSVDDAARAACACWDDQQSVYTPWRSERQKVVTEHVGGLPPGQVVDVGCGPGTLTRALAEQLRARDPRWQLTGMEADGFLVEIAALVAPEVTWRQERTLPDGPLAAVVSSAALHYLGPESLTCFYRDALERLGPDGRVVTVEELPDVLGADEENIEPWQRWWADVATDQDLGPLLRSHDRPQWDPAPPLTLQQHLSCVRDAGGHPDVLWQRDASVVLSVANAPITPSIR